MANKLRSMKRQAAMKQDKQMAPSQGQPGLLENVARPEGAAKMDPKQQKQVEQIQALVTSFIYDKKTKDNIQKALKSGDYRESVPDTALAVFTQIDKVIGQSRKKPMENEQRLSIGLIVFSEVVELAQAMQVVPQDITEEEMQPMLQSAVQRFIEKGLKDRSIDPVQLQKDVEPLLPPEAREQGLQAMKQTGLPEEPTEHMAARKLVENEKLPLLQENSRLQEQNKKMTGLMQGIAKGPQQPPPQQGVK